MTIPGTLNCLVKAVLENAGILLDGKIQDYSLILLNGVTLRNLKSTDLKEGDVLHIFPPAIGG